MDEHPGDRFLRKHRIKIIAACLPLALFAPYMMGHAAVLILDAWGGWWCIAYIASLFGFILLIIVQSGTSPPANPRSLRRR